MDRAAARTSSARVTSSGRTSTFADVLSPMNLAASSSASRRRPEMVTDQPSPAKAAAPARPIPLPPPVTQAIRFPFDVIATSTALHAPTAYQFQRAGSHL